MMRKILGLDLGTNSIGWAVVNADKSALKNNNSYELIGIEAAGSRIIPMDAAILGDFDKGNSKSQTSERTGFRGTRRLRERHLLRRSRLNRILDLLGFLPEHYSKELDKYGNILTEKEPKLAWCKNAIDKWEFLFQTSFNEMLADFRMNQPELVAANQSVPYDWTIYYLRKKALTQAITKEELAWILLNFNQKRGYYQLRGEEEEENHSKLVEFYALNVVSVEDSGDRKGKDVWYNVHLENGWIYRRTSSIPLDWVGKTKEFIVTTDLEADGIPKKDKDGVVKRSLRIPNENDWTLVKKKTEADIEQKKKTVGTYIYETLLQKPNQKVRGSLVRTIERKYYKDELKQILDKQKEFHEELRSNELYNACLNELYSNNTAHRQSIANRDFTYLFLDDVIFYQRPLKTKKALISDCPFESRFGKDGKGYPIKCIAKSHPQYQEFRLWQFISNLHIYQREKEVNGRLVSDVDVTCEFLKNEDDYSALFNWLNNRKEITQDVLLGTYFKIKKIKGQEYAYPYRWNFVEDKVYPCNETRSMMLIRLAKANVPEEFLTIEKEEALWHILYSVEDKHEIVKALNSFANRNGLGIDFVDALKKCPPFKKDYGAYSSKAIGKLLPLMRMGNYWCENAIDKHTLGRIDKIVTGEFDESLKNQVREKSINLTSISHFKGLPLWLACYIVYNRHSEAKEVTKWETPEDIDAYLKSFKQHSLRNPIVEQVITETLRTVRDIWKQVGNIDEIHVELGREMKNPADKRAKITAQNTENENANLRIRALLTEFKNPEFEIENVRPYSVSQQDILRIYEDAVLSGASELPEDVVAILKKFNETDVKKRPTTKEVLRYKLWLEQKYRSPYTGEMIPLGKLFTSAYEIEHIIPQSRYFDDSFSNKVICESVVNKNPYKDNLLGYEFIKKNEGRIVPELSTPSKTVKIFTTDEYESFVKENYSRSRSKMNKLLMEDIPDKFIERQLNDSRYISKVVKTLLSNIVREKDEKGEYEQEAVSKHLISCTGGITDRLKKDWGMNDVWNRIVLPRFERMNVITGTTHFTTTNQQGHLIPNMPLELQKGFSKKRIDHRHHAMDAIVIASATRDHVNLLNNEAAKSKNNPTRYQLSRKLRRYEKQIISGQEREVPREFKKPWDTFVADTYNTLSKIVVSFKQNLRVINKTTNYFQHFENGKKEFVRQRKGDSWAIRKPMHKDTISGEINLRMVKTVSIAEAIKNPTAIVNKELKRKIKGLLLQNMDAKQIKKYFDENREVWQDVNLSKVEIYYFTKDSNDRYFATRFTNDLVSVFDKVTNADKAKDIIKKVTDTGIQKILLAHLESKGNVPEVAFSADGIDEMNLNIQQLNNGKAHQPIYKVRIYEKGEKFAVGKTGNKKAKYAEAAKGTNLFFAVYRKTVIDKETGEELNTRSYATIPLNEVIERQKQGLKPVPEKSIDGDELLFWLSPGDLVYLPIEENSVNSCNIILMDRNRIYKMVSSSGSQCFFIQHSVSNTIVNKIEYSALNKTERAISNEMIKDICIPIKVDRLGNLIEVLGYDKENPVF